MTPETFFSRDGRWQREHADSNIERAAYEVRRWQAYVGCTKTEARRLIETLRRREPLPGDLPAPLRAFALTLDDSEVHEALRSTRGRDLHRDACGIERDYSLSESVRTWFLVGQAVLDAVQE